MECTVSWTGAAGTRSGMGFVAETGSGHALAMDGAPDAAQPALGGQNLAPRPMETLLAGTGRIVLLALLTPHSAAAAMGYALLTMVALMGWLRMVSHRRMPRRGAAGL